MEVRVEGCESEPVRVTTGLGGTTVRLMAEPGDTYREEQYVCMVRLQY